MAGAWPAYCTAAALIFLLLLIIRYQLNAFVALLVVSLGLGLASGLPPERTVEAIGRGVGDILRNVAVILALGAMLGRMLDVSGAAEVIARTLVRAFGEKRASFAVLVAAFLIGIPVLFNVGFLVLIPIVWRLQRDTGRSLLWFALPLAFSLATTHSLIPPHPGIVGAVSALSGDPAQGGTPAGQVMVETILFGTLMSIPIVLVGWFGPGRWWAQRQFVTPPEQLAALPPQAATDQAARPPPSFALSVLIVTLPLLLSVVGFAAKVLHDLGRLPGWMGEPLLDSTSWSGWPANLPLYVHSPLAWLQFFGKAEIALLVPTGLAFFLLGVRRGLSAGKLSKLAGEALTDVGGIAFLFGAAGGFMEVIKATGAGDIIAEQVTGLNVSKVLIAYLVAVMMRMALGSATASILAASALLQSVARSLPGQETLIVLAVANGVTFMTQPADSGFWMIKEYCNLSVRDVMLRFNSCRITMSLTGLGLLLAYERWLL
jgi:gluconate transporter